MSAMKFDTDKPMMDLVRPEFVQGVASVLTFGAQKYAAHNWTKGLDYSRLIAALKRHLAEIEKGNDFDEESGLRHVYHVGCCTMFLACFQEWNREELDDRLKVGDVLGIHSDVRGKLSDDSTQGVPATKRNARQEAVSNTDKLSDGSVRVQYNKSGSDNPELAPRHSTRIRRSTRVSYVDAPSQEVQDEVRKTINFILDS